MKRLILTILAASALMTARAQLFSPQAFNGALLGTFIGGIAGGNCHTGFSGEGAAIGAGIGWLAGALVGAVERQSYYASQPYYSYPAAAYAQPGYGYVYTPAHTTTPAYTYVPQPVPSAVPAAPPPRPTAPMTAPATTTRWAAVSQVVTPQIADAPRVPDAPTF
jgi:hypothetical protein